MKIFKKVIAGVAALAIAVSGIGLGAVSRKEAKAAEYSPMVVDGHVVNMDGEIDTLGTDLGAVGWSGDVKLENLSAYDEYVGKSIVKIDFSTESGGQFYIADTSDWGQSAVWYNESGIAYAYFTDAMATNGIMINGDGCNITNVSLVACTVYDELAVIATDLGNVGWSGDVSVGADIFQELGISLGAACVKVDFTPNEGGGQFYFSSMDDWSPSAVWYNDTVKYDVFTLTESVINNGCMMNGDGVQIDKVTLYGIAPTGINLDNQKLVFTKDKNGFNKEYDILSATVTPSNTTFSSIIWSSDNENVATVDENGKVTPLENGTAIITAKTADGKYSDTCEVSVEIVKPNTIIISGAQTDTVKGGDVVSLETEIAPDNAVDKTVVWSSSDTAVATVDANGKVTFANVAETKTVKITATSNADPSVKADITFTVEKLVIDNPVTGVTISNKTLELKKGETGTLSATVAPEDASLKTVTWSSSDESVATVDSDGKVTAVGMGTATITVKTVDGEKTDSCEVTITAPSAESVTVIVNGEEIEADEDDGKFKLSIMEGRKRKLTVSALPEDAVQKFAFISSDDSVVTVDEDGNLVAVAVGEAVITVTADGASKEIEITVTEKSNVPYVTDEGTVIFDGEETTAGIWDPAAACREYFKQDGSLDFSIITEDSVIKAYYTSDKAPQLVLQKYNDENLNWVKVAPYLVEDGVAYFSYEDMVKTFGDLTVADALYISADGAVITVTKVVVAEKAETDNGSVSVGASGEFKPAIEMSKEEVIDAIKNVLSEEQLAAIEDGTAKIEIELNVANIDATVSQEDKDIIADALKNIADSDKLNFMVMNYLDITFGANVDGEVIKISETDGMITISVSLDKAVNGTYKVVRIHDGKAEVIDSELSEDGTKLTFKTDKFSTYAIVFADVASGDNAPVALIALIALALAAAVIVTAAVKKAAKQN